MTQVVDLTGVTHLVVRENSGLPHQFVALYHHRHHHHRYQLPPGIVEAPPGIHEEIVKSHANHGSLLSILN